jgi:Rrf2 family protein
MLELAANYREGQLVQVKAIADAHGISQRFLVQILLQLKVHHLAQSTRGAAGGYQLARRPDNISLADVIHAIEQPTPAASPVLSALKPSPAVHAVGSLLQELDTRERQMLAEITLADLLRRTEQAGTPSYQI